MATLWISFRIENETRGGKSYSERYMGLVDAVLSHKTGPSWEGTTSFIMIETSSSRQAVATSVARAISISYDTVIIGSMDTKGLMLVGSAGEFSTLQKLAPDVTLAT
ncbi:hypothetical protein D3C81_170380 [compost metagenome]